MTWSIVGSAGAQASSNTGSVTVNCGQASTAGNLLVLTVFFDGSSAGSVTTPANWTSRITVAGGTTTGAWIFDFLNNTGSISSVALTTNSSGTYYCQIIEYTCPGVATATADKTGTLTGAAPTSPFNIVTSAAVTANNELAVTACGIRYSTAKSITLAAGTGFTLDSSFNNGVSGTNHGCNDHELDTGSSSGSTVTDAVTGWTTTGTSAGAGVIATYAQGAVASLPPSTSRQFAVQRAANY